MIGYDTELEKIAGTVGMLTGVTGAILVALGISMVFGYFLFILSAVSWIIVGLMYEDRNITITNSVFLLINTTGFLHYLGAF